MFSVMLINIVEVSNVFSVLVIFLVFCAMVVFILRLQGDDIGMTSVRYNPRGPTGPLPVTKVFNPFAFNLQAQHCKLNDAVCVVSSQVPWSLLPLWGVDIVALHEAVSSRRSWSQFRDQVLDVNGKFLDEACLRKASLQRYSEIGDLELHLSPSIAIDPIEYGRPPRTRYPLAVVLISLDDSGAEDTRVGAMIIVIHIKDVICTAASCVVLQYLKLTNGQLSNLQQLYVSSENDDDDEDVVSAVQSKTESGSPCLICRAAPASRALLPCRHVCSCRRCFEQLDRCPMCRSLIQTYFCIRDETAASATDDVREESETDGGLRRPQVWNHRLRRWNDWLNRTLGFT